MQKIAAKNRNGRVYTGFPWVIAQKIPIAMVGRAILRSRVSSMYRLLPRSMLMP
jgi:hypothetical protein